MTLVDQSRDVRDPSGIPFPTIILPAIQAWNIRHFPYNADPTRHVRADFAIQRAMNDASAAGGGYVYIPSGSYLCQKQLVQPTNVVLIGDGFASELFFDWLLATDPKGSTYIINSDTVNGTNNIGARQLRIAGAGDGTPFGNAQVPASGILYRQGLNVFLDEINLFHIPGIGASFQGTSRWWQKNIICEGTGRDGVTNYSYGQALRHGVMAGIIVDQSGDDGCAVHSENNALGAGAFQPYDISMSDIHVVGHDAAAPNLFGRGVVLTGVTRMQLKNISVEKSPFTGLYIQKDATNGFAPSDVEVENVNIKGAGTVGDGSQPGMGVFLRGAIDCQLGNVNVDGAKQHGIFLREGTTGTRVKGFRIKNCGTVINSEMGVALDGQVGIQDVRENSFSDGYVTGSAAAGAWIFNAPYTKMINVQCDDNGRANVIGNNDPLSSGIYYEGAATTLELASCRAKDTGGGGAKKQSWGLYMNNAAGSTVQLNGGDYRGNTNQPGVFVAVVGQLCRSSDLADDLNLFDSSFLPDTSGDNGDASKTIRAGNDNPVQFWRTALTANRVVTLDVGQVRKGARFRVVRTGLGAFTLDVGGLKTLPAGVAASADVEHDGTAWRLTGYMPL